MTTTDAASATAAAVPKGTGRSPRDMALSLLVLMIPVLLVVLAYRYLYGGEQPVTVDPTETIASAERAGMSPLPQAAAPQGWLVLRAQYRDGTLRIGYLPDRGEGAQLIQARIPAAKLIDTELGADADRLDRVDIDGVSWQRLRGASEEALVREIGDLTVLLVGKGADLESLAAAYPR